jgi:sugar lactone lactonase YvrE
MKLSPILLALPILAPFAWFACGGGETTPKVPPTTTSASATVTAPPPSATVSASASASAAPTIPPPTPLVKITGFATPESVQYDPDGDRYFVSNVSGPPTVQDNNGYISIASPDGKIVTEKWVAGLQNGVTLHAPKGMGIYKGVLWVADIDTVRSFDLKTGKRGADVTIHGATFLNDIAIGPDGKVYVTDSGLQGNDELVPSMTDAVYVIEKGVAKELAKTRDLKNPNGITVTPAGVLVNTFGGNEVYRLGPKGEKLDITLLPKGKLDGLFALGDTLYVSSWEGQAIYKGKLHGTFETIYQGLVAPADVGYDSKRKRILVPKFLENCVDVFDLK